MPKFFSPFGNRRSNATVRPGRARGTLRAIESLEKRLLCTDTAGNNPASARDLGTVPSAISVAETVSSTDNDDFFKFTIGVGGQTTVRIDGLSSNANLQLFDGLGTTILAGSSNTGTTADQISMSLPGRSSYMVHVKYVGPSTANYTLKITPPPAITNQVDLSSAFNDNGMIGDNQTSTAPGFDVSNDFYSFTALDLKGFKKGPANANNFIRALGQTVTLPAGNFPNLNFIAASSNSGAGQTNQTFKVNYSDGTSQTFTRSISDWTSTGPRFPNETTAATMPYRLVGGVKQFVQVKIYEYSLAINSAKTVKSITLPNNSAIGVFAINLARPLPTFSEPGGTTATATNLGNVGTVAMHVANSINKTTDTVDFYKVTTTANGLLKIVGTGLSANPPQGDFFYGVDLFTSSGVPIQSFAMSNFPNVTPTIFHGTPATTYFLKVSSSGDTSTSYTLDISNGALPADKAGNTRATATSATTAPTSHAKEAFIINTFNQDDWWKKTYTAGTTKTVTITETNTTVPLKMTIVNSAGVVIKSATFDNPFDLSATFKAPTTGTYFIHVFQNFAGANGSASPYFFLSI